MKVVICEKCGSNQFLEYSGYKICSYCRTKFILANDDIAIKESHITLGEDVQALLRKCKSDPQNARRYANLILDLDPNNKDAQRYL